MIKQLADGFVQTRPYEYIGSWLEQQDKEANKLRGTYLFERYKKAFVSELTTSEFWQLFHTACNDEMSDKF